MKYHEIRCKHKAGIDSFCFWKVEVTNVTLFRNIQASMFLIYTLRF